MIRKDFSFHPNADWDKWNVQFLGELGRLYNQHSNLKDGIIFEAVEQVEADADRLLISIKINKDLMSVTTWECSEKSDFIVLIDVLNKKS